MACDMDTHYRSLPASVRSGIVDCDSHLPDGSFLTSLAVHFVLSADCTQSKFRCTDRLYSEVRLCVRRLFGSRSEIPLPVDPCSIDEFVRKFKKHNISITVYHRVDTLEYEYLTGEKCNHEAAAEAKLIFPLFASYNAGRARHNIRLLYLPHPKKKFTSYKYVYVRSLEKLYHLPSCYAVCPLCLCKVSQRTLANHTLLCSARRAAGRQTVVMPDEEACKTLLMRCDIRKKFMVPVMGFFDFESSTERKDGRESISRKCRQPMDERIGGGESAPQDVISEQELDELLPRLAVRPSGSREQGRPPQTQLLAEQRPLCYSMLFVTGESTIIAEKSHSGEPEEVMRQLVKDLVACAREIVPRLNDCASIMPHMEPGERERMISEAECCWLCQLPFDRSNKDLAPCIDHEHSSYSHRILGVAHNACNRLRTYQKDIPIYAHNFSG